MIWIQLKSSTIERSIKITSSSKFVRELRIHSEYISTSMNIYEYIWIYMNIYEIVWNYSNLYEIVWTYMNLDERVYICMKFDQNWFSLVGWTKLINAFETFKTFKTFLIKFNSWAMFLFYFNHPLICDIHIYICWLKLLYLLN
jgi:hypothetical protein